MLVCTETAGLLMGSGLNNLAELSRQPYFYLKFATLIFIKLCLYKAVFSCRNDQDLALFSKIIL